MKSGADIYAGLLACGGALEERHFARLSGQALRALIRHLGSTPDPDACAIREDILGRAICEASRRFLDETPESNEHDAEVKP